MDQSTRIVKLPSPNRLNSHSWTNEEKVFKRKERVLAEIKGLKIPLKSGLLYELRRSVFGPFLKEFNSRVYQDYIINENKLQILNWQLERYNDHDINIIQRRNHCLKNYHSLLHKAVSDCNVIDLRFLRKHVDSLSLCCCFIKEVDNSLQQFERIKVLTLCGNFIKDIRGNLLPRKLMFLELFDNFISDVSNLVQNAPTSIKHLGLGRNRLTIGSNLHLLARSKNFGNLKCIDLSDNDIYELKDVLENLKTLDLHTLSLEGNPCAVLPEYKNEILKYFPDLKYLDSTEILVKDRINKLGKKLVEPQMVFQCYRILGLPEPPKDKKNIQTIHIEVNFPLLLENSPEADKEESIEDEEIKETYTEDKKSNNSNNDHHKKDKAKNKKEKEEYVETKEKEPKKAKKSYYAADSEYDESSEKQNIWFKTARMPWSKIIEYPPIEISPPENNLALIRDTFRSIVPVRMVYLKVAPFSLKSKKQQPKKKETDKNLKKSLLQFDTIAKGSLETVEDVEETVLKKITLASFYCELKSLNWSDNTIDFYWAEHESIGKTALRIEGSLKELEYDLTASPKKSKPTKNEEDLEDLKPKKEYLPNVLTCQVGFGLSRYLI